MNGKSKKFLITTIFIICGIFIANLGFCYYNIQMPEQNCRFSDMTFNCYASNEIIGSGGCIEGSIFEIDGQACIIDLDSICQRTSFVEFDSDISGIGKLIYTKDNIVVDSRTVRVSEGYNSYEYIYFGIQPDSVTVVLRDSRVKIERTTKIVAHNKPVIYLYPEEETEVNVELDFHGDLTCTYPAYNDGWNVIASPDGTLTNLSDGRTYDYLFWEGNASAEYPMDNAVCVKGEDTCEFLEEYLTAAGLNDSEIDDFITYWLPEMQDNPYNLIAFQGELYEQVAELHVTPEPDSVLRIFMTFEALDEPVECGEFSMPEPFERSGFTVVEWGGTNLSK